MVPLEMRSEAVVSAQPLGGVLGSTIEMACERAATEPAVRCLCGRDAVAAMQPRLVELCLRTGQAGAMDWLEAFLGSPDSRRKTPHLLLVGDAGAGGADQLRGAMLIYEYRAAGLGTGVFATDDIFGTRTVIAPLEQRLRVAQLCVGRLMQSNAAVVFASVDRGTATVEETLRPPSPDVEMAMRDRSMPLYLPLSATADETLASFGARTRRNLRCYRRRAEAELGAEFVAEARPTLEEFLALNRASTHPLAADAVMWRHALLERSAADPATLYAGLRSGRGEWLSIVWGRRDADTTQLIWQMNAASTPRHSLCTAMRAFLLEHEIARGSCEFHFVGGTHRSMHAAFSNAVTTDILAVRRGSLRAGALRRFAQRLLPKSNFLRDALADDELLWVDAAAA